MDHTAHKYEVSIVIPAKNEADSLATLLPDLKSCYPDYEIVVVNDGSTDKTLEVCQSVGVRVITHAYSKGNGAAIKTGARAAGGEVLVFMDADGQHQPQDVIALLDAYSQGYHLVVGARQGQDGQANKARWMANSLYNKLATWMVGHEIKDLTSGFRVVNAAKFREFIDLLPNGFSYPTTSTMAFYRAGYSVGFVSVDVHKRIGQSHISPLKDGVRFLLIMFKIATLYSPLKIFFPIALSFFLSGILYFTYNYTMYGRFTNMTALLLSVSVLVFLIGLVSEQITNLMYMARKEGRN